jgi:hypothetical protein
MQKVKVEQIEEQKVGSKADLEKAKVEYVEEGSTLDIQVETIDQIYDQRFQKYLGYCWIQKSIIQNATSRSFKRDKDQLSHINCSYRLFPTSCTKTKVVDLNWDDFAKFCKLLYSTIIIHEHVIIKKLNVLHFLNS